VATLTHRDFWGKAGAFTYELAGVNGDTGGTLTTPLKKIYGWTVNGHTAVGAMLAALQSRVSGRTIVVTYTDPLGDHTVRITAWGLQA